LPRNAAETLGEISAAMAGRYERDCVAHACALAEVLRAEGARPWIGRVRDVESRGDAVIHHPLIPKRFGTLTWNTHYICCAGGEVYDPIAAEPIDVDDYAVAVFGRPLKIETFLDSEETERLLSKGTLRQAFRPRESPPPLRKKETRMR
jgi:hypothetical protein